MDDIGGKFLIFSHSNTGITYLSGGCEAIFGLPPQALLGQPWTTAIQWSPGSLVLTRREVQTMIRRRLPSQELEVSFTRQDGSMRILHVVHHPVWDANGDLIAIEGLAEDITDQKAQEAELRHSNAELARATRLKDEFLANMSHELRTPLNAIIGMTEGLQEEFFGPLNDKQKLSLQTVQNSSSHLLALINDILDLAKVGAGKVELNYSWVSLPQLCASSIALIQPQARQKQIQVNTDFGADAPHLLIDEIRMRQVLLNLLSNAVKFTPNGGTVTLAIRPVPSKTTPKKPDHIQITVRDTGISISPEDIPKLFQTFVQIDSAFNRRHMGTGLGLALVKQLVELHGGTVDLTSEIGAGSCFTITLPTQSQSSSSSLPPHPAPPPDTLPSLTCEPRLQRAPRLLLVEDSLTDIDTLLNYLEARGYHLTCTHNGQDAITLTQTEAPDLILMDIHLPILDGLEAIRQIRQQPDLCQIPIIALTALAMESDRERCLAAGANLYISKPVKLKHLDGAIRKLLAQCINSAPKPGSEPDPSSDPAPKP